MPNPLLIFRIGWMDTYQGIDKIHGGGSYVAEHGEGGEMWNFREEGGRYYGYVMTKNFAGVDLSRIMPDEKWEEGDESSDIDIAFISTSPEPNVGQVVIGWYKNATVFHKEYRKRRGSKKHGDWDNIDYLCEVSAENGTLLKVPDRTFQVPRGKGFPGQSNVWYENDKNAEIVQFKKQLRRYINVGKIAQRNFTKKGKRGAKPNKKEILAIERAAIEKVWELYEKQGYELSSVEADNVGWDLEATNGEEILLIEVKGHKGNVVQFELTPNEYTQLQEQEDKYRVCVVRNALSEPDLTVFSPKKKRGNWLLAEIDGNEKVRLDEKVAAKAVQIGF